MGAGAEAGCLEEALLARSIHSRCCSVVRAAARVRYLGELGGSGARLGVQNSSLVRSHPTIVLNECNERQWRLAEEILHIIPRTYNKLSDVPSAQLPGRPGVHDEDTRAEGDHV